MKDSFLQQPFCLGDLTLSSNIFCAPLAGCSDLPFRRMAGSYKPGLMYCEMVKMDAIVRNDPHTFRLLDYEAHMHPIGAQLCGSKPHLAAKAARIIEELGFDVLDLNCGCPVDKVTKDGSGSGLLKNPQLIGEILSNIIAAVRIPVTVKIRAGWDENEICAMEITQVAEQAGAKAICIHGRTRAQGYRGPANWDYIRDCKKVAKQIKVIGNGDITDAKSALNMFMHTGCDAILIARGNFGQPWIIEDVYRILLGQPVPPRNADDYRTALMKHMDHILSYQSDRKAVLDMRRISCWYLKNGVGTRKLKEALFRAKTMEEVRELISSYDWAQTDFSSTQKTEEEDATCEV